MRHSPFTVIYDACVLFPAPLRDFLMWLALSGRFRARWSAAIHEERSRSVLRDRPDIGTQQLGRTVALMNAAIPDALVTEYEALIEGLELPDPDDRHVLAAAIRCNASVIVTFNERDFPATSLAAFGIEAQHLDAFADYLFDLDPAAVLGAAQKQRSKLYMPPMTTDEFLGTLLRHGLTQTVKNLTAYREVL